MKGSKWARIISINFKPLIYKTAQAPIYKIGFKNGFHFAFTYYQ